MNEFATTKSKLSAINTERKRERWEATRRR